MRHLFFRHKKVVFAACFVAVVMVGWLIGRVLPAGEDDIRRSACLVEGHRTLCLVDGGDTLLLHTDSVSQQGVWVNRHWWWPSCNGRVLTLRRVDLPAHAEWLTNADSLRAHVAARTDSLASLLARKETERKELIYYLRSHGVIDEGYTQIAAYAQKQTRETDSLKGVVAKLQAWVAKVSKNPKHSTLNSKLLFRHYYRVSWFDGSDSLCTVASEPQVTAVSNAPMIIHTRRLTKPWGVYAVRNVMWGAPSHKKIITVTLAPHAPKVKGTILATGSYDRRTGHNLPHLFAVDGSPVFTVHGRFIGIISGKEVLQ